MNRTHLVKLSVTNYYEVEVQAPDDYHIFNADDPTYGKHLSILAMDKLKLPEYYSVPDRKERIVEIVEVIQPEPIKPKRFCCEDLEKEIFSHA